MRRRRRSQLTADESGGGKGMERSYKGELSELGASCCCWFYFCSLSFLKGDEMLSGGGYGWMCWL